ncbi:MAG: response regulator transcription factor [Spirochaetales bacterium]
MKHILIIEDDALIADLQRDYLELADFQVTTETDGKKGLQKALENDYNLIVLDVMLPSLNGYEICKEIQKHKQIPVIFVTARKEDIDKIRGLSLGATDYIVKPFSPAELVARIKAHILHYEKLIVGTAHKNEREIVINDLRINPQFRRVHVKNIEVSLANKEYELLYFMAMNPNAVFSKEVLFDRIWGQETFGDIATVTVHINRLRDKIEEDSSKPHYIQTVWGVGYRFVI